MESENIIHVKGNDTMLLILPVKVAIDLRLKGNEKLKFQVKNGQLLIMKLNVDYSAVNAVASIGGKHFD
jgi:antitoxin component of MazEF toxin-antitoxin module